MSFEAVPCMFQSTATDGNSASYIGLLIRPSNSANVSQTPTVIPAVVAPTINVQKTSHVVPPTVLKIPYSQKSAKTDVSNSVFRLQSGNCSTPQCDPWAQRDSSNSFQSSSPAQPLPHMNASDAYSTVSSPSTSSFFPPIASIAQGFSSGKSNLELMSDCSPIPRNSNHKASVDYCDYGQNSIVNHRYNLPTIPDRYPHVPMELPSNRLTSSCKYSGYNGTSDCSATPDSGIQSIGDSPRSIGQFVTPMASPASFIPMSSNEMNDSMNLASKSFDDYSDMPRLVPYHQMEEPGCSNSEEAPQITDATRSENEEMGNEEQVPKIAITSSVNVNELVEQLMSHLGPEQRKQFADAIKSKVVDEYEKNVCSSSNQVSPPADGSVDEEAWETVPLAEQLNCFGGGEDAQQCEMPTYVAETDDRYGNNLSLGNKEDELWATERIENYNTKSVMPLVEHEQQELCEDEHSFVCQLRTDGSEEETKKRRDEREEDTASYFEEGNSSESSPKERIPELVFVDNNASALGMEPQDQKKLEDMTRKVIETAISSENSMKPMRKRKSSTRCEKGQGKKAKLKKATVVPSGIFVQAFEIGQEFPVGEKEKTKTVSISEETGPELHFTSIKSTIDDSSKRCLDSDSEERLRLFRSKVRQQMNDQLNLIVNKVEQQLSGLQLQLGPRMHWDLPWYRLNWKQVAQRIAEKNRLVKIARENSLVASASKPSRSKNLSKRMSKKNDSSLLSEVTGDVSERSDALKHRLRSYTTIKENVIIDPYPKVEHLVCLCKAGFCSLKEQCLNRIRQVECTSDCPRGKSCTNHEISNSEYAYGLEAFLTCRGDGVGVRTSKSVLEGQLVCEYVGEVLSSDTFNKRRKHHKNYKRCLAMNLFPGFLIDAHRKGNVARFVNHSCNPNCEIQQWTVNGQRRLVFVALRDIKKGEELTVNHNLCAFDSDNVTYCSCETPTCSNIVKKDDFMTNVEKKIASRNGVLLVRNVEKSVKRKILATQARKLQNEQQKNITAEHLAALRSYCDEVLGVFVSSSLPKKQLAVFHAAVNSLLQACTEKQDCFLQAVDTEIQNTLDIFSKDFDKRKMEVLKSKVTVIKMNHAESLKGYGNIPSTFGEKHDFIKKKLHGHRILTATTNLSYLESQVLVGSYDPDDTSEICAAGAESDCVRCICGITDDDGSMIQCDSCHFWLHDDCVYLNKPSAEDAEFTCDFCKCGLKRTPAVDIPLRPQPDIKWAGCTYYRTLVNAWNIQIRLNETVYTKKLANDDHKEELRRLSGASKESDSHDILPRANLLAADTSFHVASYSRKDLRCFRVVRLFMSPGGHKFVFGSHYARPHEVFCEPGRMFHKNELFATNMFDTLPLDAVVGRCLALEPRVYSLGRPKMPRYHESDVYFYEFGQSQKNSRYFDKKISSKDHYYFNTGPHNFNYFPKKLVLERKFTPFVLDSSSASHSNLPSSQKPSGNGLKRFIGNSRRNKKNKVARLEKLVQKLSSQTSVSCSVNNPAVNNRGASSV